MFRLQLLPRPPERTPLYTGDACIRAHSGRQIDRFLRNNRSEAVNYLDDIFWEAGHRGTLCAGRRDFRPQIRPRQKSCVAWWQPACRSNNSKRWSRIATAKFAFPSPRACPSRCSFS
ncbi:MAG: hypothetical protein HT580_02465 [Dechloromonas sp.]|nr:MAG: hypothetical protein HT580_02465 [Dechloromonas sp.]